MRLFNQIKKTLRKISFFILDLYDFLFNYKSYRVRYTCFWPFHRLDGEKYPIFEVIPVEAHLSNLKPNIEFFSVLNLKKEMIDKSKADIKIFFTGEDTEKRYTNFDDYCLSKVDMAIGFKYENRVNNSNYVRYPLWLFYYFGFILDKEIIKEKVKWFNERHSTNKKFCSLIASHDDTGIRKEIYDIVNTISEIDCPGRLFHNDDSLKNYFNDNKVEYLNDYMFNICPENVDSSGYVTEKIFECFAAGVVPIYWGSDGTPEPECINMEAVIVYDKNNKNEMLNKIRTLYENKEEYNSFIMKDKLLPTAVDYIYERNILLKKNIEQLFIHKLRG